MTVKNISALALLPALLMLSACVGRYDVMGSQENNPYITSNEAFENALTDEARQRRAAHEGDISYPSLASVPARPSPRMSIEEAAISLEELEAQSAVSREDVIEELDAMRELERPEHNLSAEDALQNAINESETITEPQMAQLDIPEGIREYIIFDTDSILLSGEAKEKLGNIGREAASLALGLRIVSFQNTSAEFMEQALAISLIEARMEAVESELHHHIGFSNPIMTDMIEEDNSDTHRVDIYFIDPRTAP